ncbi:MAG: host-nuclease inhibitor protein Gam [Alphaproteobacteria bacterium]|nr:MAG: host-nuclease inhibitor protein Gam [Alphaproteobacteria bacterium]
MRDYILRIGRHQNERKRIEAAMNDRIQKIRDEYQAKAAPHAEAIAELSRGVQVWCEAHRAELTQNGKRKSADLGAGEIMWRMRPPKVSLRNVTGVIETLNRLGLTRFLRTKIEVNKEAILAEPDAVEGVKGISITQGEDFVIKPHESELEEVA